MIKHMVHDEAFSVIIYIPITHRKGQIAYQQTYTRAVTTRERNEMMITATVAVMTVDGPESSDDSLRDTVTGDENSPPPTAVTACT